MLDVLEGHNDGDHIGVPNKVKIFSTIALMTRVNVRMQEP
jgi:hypothetical protein